jgi:hypothetical protein
MNDRVAIPRLRIGIDGSGFIVTCRRQTFGRYNLRRAASQRWRW